MCAKALAANAKAGIGLKSGLDGAFFPGDETEGTP
jgi:hypothetical protein